MRIRFALRPRAQFMGLALAIAAPLTLLGQEAAPPAPDVASEDGAAEVDPAAGEVAGNDDAEGQRSRPLLDTIFRRWDINLELHF